MSKNQYIIPIFVPHRGCPNDCVFCNQEKITGLSTDLTVEDVISTIDAYLETIPNNKNIVIEIGFFGGSFTGINLDIQKEFLSIAKSYKDNKLVQKIRLSTRPDYITSEILDVLKNYGVDTIELGVQSLENDVLIQSNRGHLKRSVYDAVACIKASGIKLGLQFMVGLPGDTKALAINTGLQIAKLQPNFVRIYPTLVIKGTPLEKLFFEGKYTPLTLQQAVDICTNLSMIFNYKNIDIIRIGLQPTDNINLEKDVVAGPFHPAFRQLVESHIYQNIFKLYFSSQGQNFNSVKIYGNNKELANLVGHKRMNIKYLKTKYGIEDIKVVCHRDARDYIMIEVNGKIDLIKKEKYIEMIIKERNLLI